MIIVMRAFGSLWRLESAGVTVRAGTPRPALLQRAGAGVPWAQYFGIPLILGSGGDAHLQCLSYDKRRHMSLLNSKVEHGGRNCGSRRGTLQ